MLDFIFKYTWIGMIGLVYIIMGIISIKDIIETVRRYHYLLRVSLDNLKESTWIWILLTIAMTFLVSFGYWLSTYYKG